MKLEKIVISILNIICHIMVFMFLYVGSVAILKAGYLYLVEWTSRNLYCYVWVLPLALSLFGRHKGAWCITLGNLIFVILGQTLGDYLYQIDFFGDSAMGYHHGFQIWASGVLFSIVLAIAVEFGSLVKKFWNNRKRTENA